MTSTVPRVGLGGQFFMRRNSQDAIAEFRPYFDVAPVYGYGPSLEEFMAETPLTVGSPQQLLERTLSVTREVGHYQRQLFLVDHAGLPLKTVLEQLDLLGEILPELRRGFAEGRPAHIPEAPTHASLVAARAAQDAGEEAEPAAPAAVDDVTGRSPDPVAEAVEVARRPGCLGCPSAARVCRRSIPRPRRGCPFRRRAR
jgi:hypothetical protein